MSKRSSRRLSLKKETLRSLDGRELAAVAGGLGGIYINSIGSTVTLGCDTTSSQCVAPIPGLVYGYPVSYTL